MRLCAAQYACRSVGCARGVAGLTSAARPAVCCTPDAAALRPGGLTLELSSVLDVNGTDLLELPDLIMAPGGATVRPARERGATLTDSRRPTRVRPPSTSCGRRRAQLTGYDPMALDEVCIVNNARLLHFDALRNLFRVNGPITVADNNADVDPSAWSASGRGAHAPGVG